MDHKCVIMESPQVSIPQKKLPIEIMDKISLLSDDVKVSVVLRNYTTDYAYDRVIGRKKILIHGPVQSGKTKKIISFIKSHSASHLNVLVIQNSLAVLSQYKDRLDCEKIEYQTITKNTKKFYKTGVILMIANKNRHSYFKKLIGDYSYNLIIDEADLLQNRFEFSNTKAIIHVTATPYSLNNEYHHITLVKPPSGYRGLDDLSTYSVNSPYTAVRSFMKESSGMMLINHHIYISDMGEQAENLSIAYPEVPVLFLSSVRYMVLNGVSKILPKMSISKIIDSTVSYPHVIIIANRLVSRGLSFVSSDYSRHLTSQYTDRFSNISNFAQNLRILGVYSDKPMLKLYIPDNRISKFLEYKDEICDFDISSLSIG